MPRRLFAVLLILTAVYRFSLLGHGALAFVDETFYFTAVKSLQSLSAGDVRGAVQAVSQARGRNAMTIVRLPIAALQAIPAHYGVPASNLRSLLIPTAANVLVTLLSLYFVFSIATRLAGNEFAALVAAAVYALMTSSNLYVRHLVPYDWAMCAGLGALWLAFTSGKRRSAKALAERHASAERLAVWTGALTGATLTLYTGYYPFCAVIGLAILWEAWSTRERREAIRFVAVFAVSAAAVIGLLELLFQAGELSYIGSLQEVGRDIAFKSYDDGFSFLPKYLVDVERFSGVVLMLGAVVSLWQTGKRFARGILRPIDRISLPLLVAVLAQAASSVVLHAIPLYGRLIHPWMPFLAWMLADALTYVPSRARAAAYAAVLLLALASFGPTAWRYLPLKYPPDVLYEYGIDTSVLPDDHLLCELMPGTDYASPAPLERQTNAPYTRDSGFVLLNFCQALPQIPRPRQRAALPAGARRVFDGPHWMSFPAYTYEGLIRADRLAMQRENYRLQVYK